MISNIFTDGDTYAWSAKATDLDGVRGDEIVVVIGQPGGNGSRLRVLAALGDGGYALGSVAPIGGEDPSGPWLADFDGDGDLDAACIANYEAYDGILHVRWNDGHGNLTGIWSRRIAGARIVDAVVDDFDDDGAADLAVVAQYYYESGTRVALLYGRRDEASARTSHTDFANAPDPGETSAFAIGEIRPNPARDRFTIQWTSASQEPLTLDFHDVAGRRVRSAQISGSQPGERETRFESLGDLPAGLYWIRIRQGNAVATKRVALIR